MKLEREDIPAFKGKSWLEQIALRDRAKLRDHSIVWLQCLSGALMVPIMLFCDWLLGSIPHRSLWFIALGTCIASPILILFRSLFITPRIRKALESERPAI